MATSVKFLGTCDDVTTCDCCGKKDLKSTVAHAMSSSTLPSWRRELGRLRAVMKDMRNGALVGITPEAQERLRSLEVLAALEGVVESGQGEAEVPECVAKHLRWENGTHSPSGRYKLELYLDNRYWTHRGGDHPVREGSHRLLTAIDMAADEICKSTGRSP